MFVHNMIGRKYCNHLKTLISLTDLPIALSDLVVMPHSTVNKTTSVYTDNWHMWRNNKEKMLLRTKEIALF